MYPYIDLFGKKIGTYGLCMVVGIFLAGWLSLRRGKERGLKTEDLLIVAAFALLFALPCGGILYAFVTYSPSQVWHSVISGDFTVFGGLVFYGGLIGGIIGAMIGIIVAKTKFTVVESSVVPYIPVGHAIGRIGCLLAGCCRGIAYDGPLAIYYQSAVTGVPIDQGYFPVQLLEALINIEICLTLIWIDRKERKPGAVLSSYIGLYAVARFILEYFRGDSIRGIYDGLSTSQWIAIATVVCSLTYFLITPKSYKQ